MTPRSSRAIANGSALCKTLLRGRYDRDVVDLYPQPEPTPQDQSVAPFPMLVKLMPFAMRRIFGELEDMAKTLHLLDLTTPA